MPPHFVHRIVQYSDPARPEMMLSTLRPASHSGQLDRTLVAGLVWDSSMGTLPYLFNVRAALIEIIDAGLRVGYRRIGIGPGETDLELGK
jgi:hypothetical protein